MAFVLLLVAAFATDQLDFVPSAIAIGSIAFQGIFVAFLAFLIWFWLLRNYHVSPNGILSFMTPIFGVLLGAWLLSEPLRNQLPRRKYAGNSGCDTCERRQCTQKSAQ